MTADRVPTLSSAIGTFANLVNTPRSQIVNRCTLLKEVETDKANRLERVGDPDDLVLNVQGDTARCFQPGASLARSTVRALGMCSVITRRASSSPVQRSAGGNAKSPPSIQTRFGKSANRSPTKRP